MLVHATIFSQTLEDVDGTRLRFGKSSALALVYLGICAAVSFIVSVATLVVLINAFVRR